MDNATKVTQVRAAFLDSYGIDPSGIYCLVTGKRIGQTDSDEMENLIDSLPDNDSQLCADDLAMRLFASMRPSMRWNKMRTESLDTMRRFCPVETFAYLLNRLFMPVDRAASYVTEHGERIKTYNFLAKIDRELEAVGFDAALHRLLEIDAKLGLHTLTAKFTCRDMLTRGVEFLWQSIDTFYDAMLIRIDSQKAEQRYMSANPLAKQAFFKSYMEQKPASPSKTRLLKKAEDDRFLSALFDEVLHLDKNRLTPAETELQVGINNAIRKASAVQAPTVAMPRVFSVGVTS